MGSGLFNKVVLRFDRVFWDANIAYVGHNTPVPEGPRERAPDSASASAEASGGGGGAGEACEADRVGEADRLAALVLRQRHNVFFVNYAPAAKGQPLLIALISGDLARELESKVGN